MVAALDGPHVGVGLGMGMLVDDGVYDFQVGRSVKQTGTPCLLCLSTAGLPTGSVRACEAGAEEAIADGSDV